MVSVAAQAAAGLAGRTRRYRSAANRMPRDDRIARIWPIWRAGTAWRHRRRLSAVVVIASACAMVLLVLSWRSGWPGSEPQVGSPVPPQRPLAPDEAAFYAYVDPRLRALNAEVSAAAELGRSKSRNLFAFQRHGTRIRDLSDELDGYLAEHAPPPRFAAAIAQYRQGIAAVRQAMDEAQSGLLRLDWSRVATAIPVMSGGAAEVNAALIQLEQAAGVRSRATPSPASN